jgi:hypothetical protein
VRKEVKMIKDQIRQGDVLLQEVAQIDGKEVERAKGSSLVLALGEATGHHHRFEESTAKMFRQDDGGGRVFALLEPGSKLVHEEHGPIEVLGRHYEQAQQVEYTPQALRRVAD